MRPVPSLRFMIRYGLAQSSECFLQAKLERDVRVHEVVAREEAGAEALLHLIISEVPEQSLH